MIAIALSVRAQEGSRYDRFSPLVKGVFRPSVEVFGVTWDTDLVGSKEGRARAREGERAWKKKERGARAREGEGLGKSRGGGRVDA